MSTGGQGSKDHRKSALIAGIAAFSFWGLVPVYWKLLQKVPASEIIAHRFVWTTACLVALLTFQRRWSEVAGNARSRRTAIYCFISGLMIAINWLVFIWAVNIGRVIETSLGYFMTPLVNVLLGAIVLRERLTRVQLISVVLAAAAVLYLTFGYGRFPWIALTLCVTFGMYGFLRKQSGTGSIPGLFLETTLLVPIAFVYLIALHRDGTLVFSHGDQTLTFLLITTGVITTVPLLWFGHAARYLRLTTLGFLQYLSPSSTFFLGIFLYHEPFTLAHLIAFSLIWIALALFTWDAVARWHSARAGDAVSPPAAPA